MATIALRTTTTFPAETPRTASVGTPEYAKTDPTPYLLPATRVHPIAIAIPLLAYAWLGVAGVQNLPGHGVWETLGYRLFIWHGVCLSQWGECCRP